jgi:hypothetical protein
MPESETIPRNPGACIPWDEQVRQMPPIQGDAGLVKQIWEETDAWAYVYIWQILLSF